MVDLVDDRKALTHFLNKVLVLDKDALIVLMLERLAFQFCLASTYSRYAP